LPVQATGNPRQPPLCARFRKGSGRFALTIFTEEGEMPEPEPGEKPTTPTETVDDKPLDPKTATAEELKAELEKAQRTLQNKSEETARLHKKLESFEKAEDERKKAAMTETERLEAELKEARKQLAQLTKAEQRRAAAEKTGLPLAFADRLVGETPEELEADAMKLLEALPKGAPKPPKVEPTNPGAGASQGETIAQQRARIYGQGINVMDPQYAKEHGGGVFIKEKHLTSD